MILISHGNTYYIALEILILKIFKTLLLDFLNSDRHKTSIIQTFFKMSSLPPHSRHPPPYDDADDPLISKPEKSPRPPISFDSWEQFRWHLISLSGRCLITALSLSLLILGLRIFSRMEVLSKLEQYGFNAITILLGAFASLGLGSMVGYLGSMLRWRLLARKKYKMQDVWDTNF